MKPWFSDSTTALYHGDSLQVLRGLPSNSVQCVVTSPPYYALRDYGVDGQIGLEETPELFIAKLVDLFKEVRRILRSDGTCWVNMGDSYANDSKNGVKPKDMLCIPWMLALALRSDGWYLRQDIVWHKKSPMPESVRDRCCKAHEYIFLLTKSQRYFYDHIGSQEPTTGNAHARGNGLNAKAKSVPGGDHRNRPKQNESFSSAVNAIVATRNMRSVWSLASYALKSAHFAAYPPELVRRCLLAGVSQKGCCPNCGKPWIRITERTRRPTRPGVNNKQHFCSGRQSGSGTHLTQVHNTPESHPKSKHDSMADRGATPFRPTEFGNRDPYRHVTEVVTTGWHPACKCDPLADGCNESLKGGYLPEPCTVLDPFHGAGTTWKVCQRLGLKYIGIELNEEYLKLSVERPPVHFPHEKRRSSRAAKANQKDPDQMELF